MSTVLGWKPTQSVLKEARASNSCFPQKRQPLSSCSLITAEALLSEKVAPTTNLDRYLTDAGTETARTLTGRAGELSKPHCPPTLPSVPVDLSPQLTVSCR